MKVALIINPVSGRKRSLVAADAAEPVLRQAGWEITREFTQCPGDATRLAREAAAEGCDLVLTCGGDGSFSQALAGLLDTGIPAGIIPAGTGNDFARAVGLSLEPAKAAAQIVRGHATHIDLLAVQSEASPDEIIWCANIAGVGFDARVCERINRRSRMTGGTLAYLVAVAQEFRVFRRTPVRLHVDERNWEGEALLVAFANAQSYGGGMRIAPEASVDDGLMDVIVVKHMPRLDFARSFPRVMKGTHLSHPAVMMLRGREARIETDAPQPALVDGDIQAETPLSVRVEEGRGVFWRGTAS